MPRDQLDYQGTDVVVKGEKSDLDHENLQDSFENDHNDNVLFNQRNFLREMQGHQQAGGNDID